MINFIDPIDSDIKKNEPFYEEFDNFKKNLNLTKDHIIKSLKQVFDPEIPVNIYDLGLIYNIHLNDEKDIEIKMTLTTPNCPVADTMPESVGKAVSDIEGISSIKVELVWEPKWSQDMMTEDAKLALDIF